MYARNFSDNANGCGKTNVFYFSRLDFLSERYKRHSWRYRFPAKSRVALVSLNEKHARFLASRRDTLLHFSSHGFSRRRSHLFARLNSLRYNLHSSRIIPVIGFRLRGRECSTQRRVICRFLRVRLLLLLLTTTMSSSSPRRRRRRGAGHHDVYPGQIGRARLPGRLTRRNGENVGCRTVGERGGKSEVKGREDGEQEERDRKRSRGSPVRTTDTLLPWRLPRASCSVIGS